MTGDIPPPPPPKDKPLIFNGARPDSMVMNGHAKEDTTFDHLDSATPIANGPLFTADELSKAMSKSTLEPTVG